jgi:hypothetical protein
MLPVSETETLEATVGLTLPVTFMAPESDPGSMRNDGLTDPVTLASPVRVGVTGVAVETDPVTLIVPVRTGITAMVGVTEPVTATVPLTVGSAARAGAMIPLKLKLPDPETLMGAEVED